MTDTPDLDAILESIRARVSGEAPDAAPPRPAAPAPAPRTAPLVATPIVAAPQVTVDALMAAVLEPLLKQWIDANLPEICERVAQEEIRRLTGKP